MADAKLTSSQSLWIVMADMKTQVLGPASPTLAEECRRLGLVQPGAEPGSWVLSLRGLEVREGLIAASRQTEDAEPGRGASPVRA